MVVLEQLLEMASFSPIVAWDGRLEGSLSESLGRELCRMVSFSPIAVAV